MTGKMIIVLVSFFTLFGISATGVSSESELVDFINENIPTMREEYNETFGENWEVTKLITYKSLYDVDENEFAYLLIFDKGYLVVSNDSQLVELSTNNVQPLLQFDKKTYLIGTGYYVKEGEKFVSNSLDTPLWGSVQGESFVTDGIFHNYEDEAPDYTNFKVTMSLADDLQDESGDYGDYSIFTKYQGNNSDCGPQAAVNWMYTFDLSGVEDIPDSDIVNNELIKMRTDMDWTSSGASYLGLVFYGTWVNDFKSGIKEYTDDDYFVLETASHIDETPAVGLYFNLNVTGTAHYAMLIGQAQSDDWWIFKNNWDMIATWDANHYYSNGAIASSKPGTPSYYFVKTIFRQNTFTLYKQLHPAWYQPWKPTKELVQK